MYAQKQPFKIDGFNYSFAYMRQYRPCSVFVVNVASSPPTAPNHLHQSPVLKIT